MDEMDLERLRELVRSGDTDAFWRYWKEMERRGEWRWGWRTGYLPDLRSLRDRIANYLNMMDNQARLPSRQYIVLFYPLGRGSWNLAYFDGAWSGEQNARRLLEYEIPILSLEQYVLAHESLVADPYRPRWPSEEAEIIAASLIKQIWRELRKQH